MCWSSTKAETDLEQIVSPSSLQCFGFWGPCNAERTEEKYPSSFKGSILDERELFVNCEKGDFLATARLGGFRRSRGVAGAAAAISLWCFGGLPRPSSLRPARSLRPESATGRNPRALSGSRIR